MIPLRHRYQLENEGWRMKDVPMLSKMKPPNPLTQRYVTLRLCSMPIRFLLSLLQKSGLKASMNLLQEVWGLLIEFLQFLKPKGAHNNIRDVKFPMLFGMAPVSWLNPRFLHPNILTWVGFGVKFNVHHIKYALHSTEIYLSLWYALCP